MASDFDTYGLIPSGVTRFADNATIPNSTSNADWQQYQKWLAAGHTPRPQQPDATYTWNGTAWVRDPNLAAAANNAPIQAQLDSTDADSMRSVRAMMIGMSRLSKVYPPPPTSDPGYLVANEQSAQQQRAQMLPVAVLTLADAKAAKIEEFRIQGLAYIQIGFIAQTVTWATKTSDQILYMTLGGYQTSGNLSTADSKVHIWDQNGAERTLTPLNAGKLMGALNTWLYLAQREYWVKVAAVNACTTIAQVQALTWTPQYTAAARWNADTWVPVQAQQELPAPKQLPEDYLPWDYVPA